MSLARSLLIATGLTTLGAAHAADAIPAAWHPAIQLAAPATPDLRAFGRVEMDTTVMQAAQAGDVTVTAFRCQDPDHARTLAGKYLADLDLSPGVAAGKVTVAGGDRPLRTLPAGVSLVAVQGAVVRVITAAAADALASLLNAQPALADGALGAAPYPAYLDRFDRYGWGMYGMGGFNDSFGWIDQARGKDATASAPTPVDDVKFLAEEKFRFEPWLDPAAYDDSDGITKNTESEWMVKQAQAAGLPVSFRVYADVECPEWPGRRFGDFVEQPAPFLQSGWHGIDLRWRSDPHLSWCATGVHKYIAARTMGMMREYAGNPDVMGWMEPHGELAHDEWYDMHADFSPLARANWRAWLGKRASLAEVSSMYARTARPFASWDEVPIPEFATFAGLDGSIADLGGQWWTRSEPAAPEGDDPQIGVTAKWFDGAIDAAWTGIAAPGGDHLAYLLHPRGARDATWFRRGFALTAAQLAAVKPGERIYLYWFPMGAIGGGDHPRYNRVWVNGNDAGPVGAWGALDVTALLHAGDNQVALRLLGSTWNGRIFLSTEAPAIYPYLAGGKDRLWLWWNQWRKDIKKDAWEIAFDGMRQVDGERPIKCMSPGMFGDAVWADFCARWGAFPHFTGEGVWFYPWFKRAAFIYGLPATSEGAGPANNVAEEFDSLRRTFLAGLNGHDAVFIAQMYTRNPELREFWVKHAPLLHQMGRYDLGGPQVLIHRSTLATTGLIPQAPAPATGDHFREIASPYDWDLGRGTLETLGQSYLYLDDGAVADGRMGGYTTMIDCGNEIIAPAVIAHIAEWVKNGGTYIAYPCTGRNATEQPDCWQVEAMTGATVAAIRTPGKGTVTIKAGNSLLPGLAGKSFPDQGRCVDWRGGNHAKWDVAITPAAGTEVVATYEDGTTAITRTALGKGQVILLGSGFWRQSADRRGLWWPEISETDFVAALLAGAGQAPAQCTSSDRLVWAQPYRANNGLDAVACLVSWHDDAGVETVLRMRLPKKPVALRSFGVDGERDLPFTWADGEASATVAMPAKEVKVVRALGVYATGDALAHWWDYQQKIWRALQKPALDLAPASAGRYEDPTLDLRPLARWTAQTPGEGWNLPGFDDAAWKPTTLGVLTLGDGAPESQPLWVRCDATIPASWAAQGGTVRLVSGSWSPGGPDYLGSARLALNGTVLHDFPGASYQDFDVTRLLKPGANAVTLEFKGDRSDQGIVGDLWLYHRSPAQAVIDLGGNWTGTADGTPATAVFPGTATINRPTMHFAVPAEWAGKRVRLVMECAPHAVLGAWVNDRLVHRHHHQLSGHVDIDITDQLRFGADNELTLATWMEMDGFNDPTRPPQWKIDSLALELREQP